MPSDPFADAPASGPVELSPEDLEGWKQSVEAVREDKDLFLLHHPQSPIPPEDREKLDALPYYPPDPKYLFILPLYEYEEKETFEIQDTGGYMRTFYRWGEFRFLVDGKVCVLHAYKSDPEEGTLFVPFRDATSGNETYGAGRYMDLYEENHRMPDGRWLLDLNMAYNPYCAYSEHYVCPFVPPENWLPCPIRAGEKAYPLAKD